MRYEERRPSEALQPYVKCFWQLERTYRAGEVGETLWPDGCQEMIFHYGASYSTANDGTMPEAFFIGMLTHYHHLYADGPLRLNGVRLLPWGLAAFAERPVRSFNDRFVPLTQVLERTNSSEIELPQLAQTTTMEESQAILEKFLLSLYVPERVDPALAAVLSRMYEQPMACDVAWAAAESGYSQRQFERRCAELTGLAPKRLLMAARFNQARLRLMFHPETELQDVMADFGYYDYAHFSKDFKLCLGITPVHYQKWVREAAARRTEDVVFLQDER